MRQWDRERLIKRETWDEAWDKSKEEAALKTIRFGREYHISDDDIRKNLKSEYNYDDQTVDALFKKADSKEKEKMPI